MKKLNVQPNTDLWLEARKKYRTASEAAIVCGKSPFTTPEKFKMIKAGLVKQYYSKAMQLGHAKEAQIREWANLALYKEFVEEVWVNGRYLASVDGIDGDTVLEIKTSSRTYKDILDSGGEIPDYYWYQVQQQLYCTPATHAYLVAYCPKADAYAISSRIDIDPTAMEIIEEAWEAFDAMPVPEGDIDASDNLDLALAFERYAALKAQADSLETQMKDLKATILTHAAERTVNCRGYSIVYKKGATKTDYKKACDDFKIDLSTYQTVGDPTYALKMATPDFKADPHE